MGLDGQADEQKKFQYRRKAVNVGGNFIDA